MGNRESGAGAWGTGLRAGRCAYFLSLSLPLFLPFLLSLAGMLTSSGVSPPWCLGGRHPGRLCL